MSTSALFINTFSLDASNRHLNSYLLKDESLIDTLLKFREKIDNDKVVLVVDNSQNGFIKDIAELEKIVLDDKAFISLYAEPKKNNAIINLSEVFNEMSKEAVISIKGPINNPGIYKAPPDLPISQLVYGKGKGLKKKQRTIKSILVGGSFGRLGDREILKLTLSQVYKSFPKGFLGNSLMIFDDMSCIVNLVKILTLYNLQKLSVCPKCKFCKTELVKAYELLENITLGIGTQGTLEKLSTLVENKDENAKCNLGKSALLPLETALDIFKKEFVEHAIYKYCRASSCENLFLSSCGNSCPGAVDLPGTIGLMQKGLFVEAVALGRETNPFFLSCGRICEEPLCQKYCKRQIIDEPINSPALHRYAGEMAAKKSGSLSSALDFPTLKPTTKTDKKIAIIGAGPAGLSAAYFLARFGHKAVIFEKLPVSGGMLRIGIPDYRLPPEILSEEINHILSLGVEINYNVEVGKDISFLDLKEKYDAVYIAVGACKNNTLDIPGENLDGVLGGIEFLRKINLKEDVNIGMKVAVVGGGNVAIDAARSSLRMGAKEVSIIYRRNLKDMPAALKEIQACQKEGINILTMVNPVEIISKNGRKTAKLEKMIPGAFDLDGRRKPEKSNEYLEIEIDTFIIAIGQTPEIGFLKQNGIETKWQQVKIDKSNFRTNLKGVFAGGDCVLGPATAIEAIGHGRKAAIAIHKFLMKEKEPQFTNLRNSLKNFIAPCDSRQLQQQQPEQLDIRERIKNFNEVEKPFTKTQAQKEMMRCICSAKTGL